MWLDRRNEALTADAVMIGSDPEVAGTIFRIVSHENLLVSRVWRLHLRKGERAGIRTADVDEGSLDVFAVGQRYSCLEEGSLYLYESLNSDFRAEIVLAAHGFVRDYPGLFRRLL